MINILSSTQCSEYDYSCNKPVNKFGELIILTILSYLYISLDLLTVTCYNFLQTGISLFIDNFIFTAVVNAFFFKLVMLS